MRLEKGLIHYYHGNGKGKTSTLIGSLIRAHGHGLKTILIQFLKLHSNSENNQGYFMGEIHFLKKVIPIKQYGTGKFVMPNEPLSERDINKAREGIDFVKDVISSGEYDVIAIDEIVDTIALKLVNLDEFIAILKSKPHHVEVIFTGYNYIQSLVDIADYVTNIDMVKHPFYSGIDARKGIEY